MGNPFINAVYIGHPGWKAMGGRIGYSAATGIMVVVRRLVRHHLGDAAVVLVVAISPILLYIGMLIGSQAFQTTPLKHAPAIVLALTPHLAAWAKLEIDTMLGSTLDAAEKVGAMAPDKIAAVKIGGIGLTAATGRLSTMASRCWAAVRFWRAWCWVRSASSSSNANWSRRRLSRPRVPC